MSSQMATGAHVLAWASLALLMYLVISRWLLQGGTVSFLTAQQAASLYAEPDIRQLVLAYRPAESAARSDGRAHDGAGMLRQYALAVQDFTPTDMQTLRTLLSTTPALRGKRLRFVKMADHMDFGYPYTLRDVTVLPESFMARAQRDTKLAGVTLLHEALHVDQRARQAQYNAFYEAAWGYERPRRLRVPSQLLERVVTNPDDDPGQAWVRHVDGACWWTALLLPAEGGRPRGMAYPCRRLGPGQYEVSSTGGRPLSGMKDKFYGQTNSYSPNELYAALFSDSV